ncbi:uncharacterized protein LOC131882939 [Tigriopus californicus]|uniref:uncharacterized protein LOC131882939 n=1 Tax=Tigriopus californicus TaxID=6832 RepID=UPI0027D9FF70|nr:uncharacterized protein LOC131882939 [Tigriopus californicus]
MALKWLMTSMSLRGQLLRWREELQDYDFEIDYRPGSAHGNADALSRRPTSEENPALEIEITPEDRQMYQKLGIKPPNTGAFRKVQVNAITRSQARQIATLEEEVEDDWSPPPSESEEPNVQDYPDDPEANKSPNSPCLCEDRTPNDQVHQQLALQDETNGKDWTEEERPNSEPAAQMAKYHLPTEQKEDATLKQINKKESACQTP